MARPEEFIKRNEARIIIFLKNTSKPMRHGKMISKKLDIDYAYVMKLIEEMFDKGWIGMHRFEGVSYFKLSLRAPINQSMSKLNEAQQKLDEDGD